MFRFRLKSVIIAFIVGIVCLSFIATLFGYTSYDSEYYSSNNETTKINERKEMIQEIIHSKFQNINFSIIDFYMNNTRNRYLKHGNEKGQVTWVSLKKKGENEFEVDKNDVKAIYYRFSILAPFIVNTDLRDYSKNMSILLLGLGGGALTNYLSNLSNLPNITTIEIDPTMKEISKKWFDLKESERNQVIIGDGIDFMKKTNQTFDSIILDACTSNFSIEIICPAPEFLKFDVISKFSTKLKPNGVFSVNIGLLSLNDYKKTLNKIYKKFSKFFKFCFILYAFANHILICSNDSTDEIVKNFPARFHHLPISLQKTLKTNLNFYNPK